MKFDYFNLFNRFLFDHIFQTIELTLGFHSAKTRLDNIQLNFPELSNLNEQIMNEVYEEVKIYQFNAMHILLDLQQSYRLCWIIQMTRRCAQMLLRYESIAIIQLYETGMLEENEYSHILELIENKLFCLEYGNVKMMNNQKKTLRNPFDLIPFFQFLSSNEKLRWKSLIKSKHRWFQPGSILLHRNQRVSTAYLIIRGIVQCRIDGTSPTYYKCGSIIGIDALYSKKSLSYGTYTANGGLVEVYLIDLTLLNLFLSDEKLSRSIYDEIALHMIMNNYQKSLNLNHSKLKMLLNEKSKFYCHQSDLSIIHLQANQRLFLLSGTINQNINEIETIFDSIHFILLDTPSIYQLNASSIVYTWTDEDETYCLNAKKFKINFRTENHQDNTIEPFYPLYLGHSIEFTPRRHSSSMTRPVDNANNIQFIPSEMEVNNDLNPSTEFL
jgi:hypothetical protein